MPGFVQILLRTGNLLIRETKVLILAQAIDLVEEMEQPILKAHFLRALTRTTLKLAATSPSKSPPRIHMDPESGAEDDWNDEFRAYVDNIYSEV